jgi:putative phage-type endonuclease
MKEDYLPTYITQCKNCQQKLRVPVKGCVIQVTCPKCRLHWIVFPYKVIEIAQGTPAWHDWRNQGIGASDAPSVMGENPWKSRNRLLNEKLNGSISGSNQAMARGTELEPEARSCYERATGIRVRPACLQSLQFDWFRASVDGLAYDNNSVVEIKCGNSVYRHAACEHQVPRYYYGQLQHILAVTGLSRIDFWCYLPGHPEVRLRIDRDDSYIDKLVDAEMAFWQEILKHRR